MPELVERDPRTRIDRKKDRPRTDAPAEHPYFSAAASPVGEKDLVITHPGNYGPLTAFDVDTGVIRCTAGEGGFFQSPLITELAGTRQVVSVNGKNLSGGSVAGGKVLWQHPWAGGAGGTMPILVTQSS